MQPYHSHTLLNGLVVEFHDQSNRYFGDYWRVSIEARCRIPIACAFDDDKNPEFDRARLLIGEDVVYSRMLEKMGVPGDEVSSVRHDLIDAFLESTSPYLSDPAFAVRFVRKRLAERKGGVRPFLVPK